jgi:hypothetical protein
VKATWPAFAAVMASACVPATSGPPLSTIERPRVLAVKAEPAEARPGDRVALRLLGARPEGGWSPAAEWAFCSSPKPLTENDVVAEDCLSGAADVFAASATAAQAILPLDACQRFGPDTPPGPMMLRPRDADATGGYFQPVRVRAEGADPVVALVRLFCGLAGASYDVASRFEQQYRPNANPRLVALGADLGGVPLALDALPRGSAVHLTSSWTSSSAEAFVVFDPTSGVLAARREALSVSWYATAGAFDHDRSGRAADDRGTSADDVWQSPAVGSFAVQAWVVLRDSRGGLDFASFALGD